MNEEKGTMNPDPTPQETQEYPDEISIPRKNSEGEIEHVSVKVPHWVNGMAVIGEPSEPSEEDIEAILHILRPIAARMAAEKEARGE